MLIGIMLTKSDVFEPSYSFLFIEQGFYVSQRSEGVGKEESRLVVSGYLSRNEGK